MSPTNSLSGACPPDQIWDELAAGFIVGDRALELLEHASLCERCAATLRDAIEIFRADAEVTELRAAPRRPRWRGLGTAGAIAAVILMMVAGAYLYSKRSQDPLAQLARVYTANRTVELRLPGAAYGPLRVQRGPQGTSISDQPAEMLSAAEKIKGKLAGAPNDPVWLHAKGRLAILEWQPEVAIDALNAAMDWGRASPDLLTDLAVAFYERGKRDGNAADLNHAIELLGRALEMRPDCVAALFDRALIEEDLNEVGPAITDLEKLLRLEPEGEWSNETRVVLQRLRDKHAALFGPARGQGLDEAELDAVLTSDLSQSRERAWALSERLRQNHRDAWLEELLAAARSEATSRALDVLSKTAAIRVQMERGRYEQMKGAFDDLGRTRLPPPVEAWRQFESLYRATHARGEFRCPADSETYLHELETRGYRWLSAQVSREFGYCLFQSGEIDGAEGYAKRSIGIASGCGFPVSAIRAEALFCHANIRRGRFQKAVNAAAAMLTRVAKEGLPTSRSQEFFNVIFLVSQASHEWHSARAAAAEMTEVARAAGWRDLAFTNKVAWAQMTLRGGDAAESGELFREALREYEFLAPSTDRAWAEIGFADATGDESRLASFAPILERSPDLMLWIPYERVRARIALEKGRSAEARERLARLEFRMTALSKASRYPVYQWRTENRAVEQVLLALLSAEGQLPQSYPVLEHWRTLSERSPDAPVGDVDEPAVTIAFAEVKGKIAAWRKNSEGIAFRWMPYEREQLDHLLRRFGRLVRSAESSEQMVSTVGRQIRDALFGSWLDSLPEGEPLLIQTEGALADLDFAALPGTHAPLGLEHAISVTTFPVDGAKRVAGKGAVKGGFLFVDASSAYPEWARNLVPLPNAAREIRTLEIAGASGAVRYRVLRDAEATPDAMASQLPEMRLLHFAGHAVPTANGYALVLPGSANGEDIFQLDAARVKMPHTVVLSACSTGRNAAFDPNTEVNSLANAFLEKGSREVLASLWDVDSVATEELMRTFYARLQSGVGSARALQDAMRAVQAQARYSHPYYWAGFTRFVRV